MRIACVGDNVVDCYPDAGLMFPGGNAVNVAVAARRSGCPTEYIGAVGDDPAGEAILAALAHEQVETAGVRIVDGHTAFAVIELRDGDRVFVDSDLGVSAIELGPEDYARLAGATLVHTGDCSALESQLEAIAAASAIVSFDFSTRAADYCAPLLPYVDVAIFSVHGRDETEIERLLRDAADSGPQTVIGTRGPDGAALLLGGRVYWADAPAMTTVVDTLGAGDAFIGRALIGLLREEPPDALLAAASDAAADAVGRHGAFGWGAPLVLPERTGRRVV